MVSKIRLGPLNSWICWSRRLDTVRRFCTKISLLDLMFVYVYLHVFIVWGKSHFKFRQMFLLTLPLVTARALPGVQVCYPV